MTNKCKCECGRTVNYTWVKGHNRRGTTLSASHRKKMSDSLKGRTYSASYRKKMSDALMGRIHSIKTRKRMFEAQHGEKHAQAILTEKDVLDIQWLYKDELERRYHEGRIRVSRGFAQELSEHYDVSRGHISTVGHHGAWKYLD